LVISKTSRSFTTCGWRIILCRWYSRVAIRTYEAFRHCDQLLSTRCTLHATCGAQRQYLYFCTIKASNLSIEATAASQLPSGGSTAATALLQLLQLCCRCNGSVAAVLQLQRLCCMFAALLQQLQRLCCSCCSRNRALLQLKRLCCSCCSSVAV